MFKNLLKEKIKAGKKTAGAWVQLASPFTAEIFSSAGFDWLMLDMEHAPGDILTLVSQVHAMKGTDTVPLVRTPWNDFVAIKKILDAGAQGVLIPYVNNKEEAELAVKTCKYPTEGIRGVAGSPRAAGYGMNIGNYLQRANEEIFIMIAVETPEAVKNLDEILEVEGLDGIFIGPMDLASSMGYFGNPSEPKVQAAIKEIEGKVFASDKVLATTTGTWEGAQTLYERGYDMLMLMADGINLAKMAKQKMTEFREHYPNG
ncbi:MAG: 2,4-dihydroxyhept-2-ene-1,7-dioic acid aldolase [Anaerolineae bacterium]|jgi:2-keto-3-deoxy-L-rhamnonate aldolase RhmA|nr:2,4-dihydroxyhept-2-ene-1,7-dioic acid aldolase [Anaerolineae bacterium]MBT7990711.1 2,4-dihydroxyhept-2-ene-1,7-dioic acid aldolase [Anaerolineae bacterium]